MNTKDFHFLITDNLIKRLNEINELKQISFSGKIRFIISKIDKIINYIKYFEIDEASTYEYLNNKKNVHIYMKQSLYKKIKYYHGKFNTYSIALFVRMILRTFLSLVKKYGYLGAIKKINEKYKCIKKLIKKYQKKFFIRQLLDFLNFKDQSFLKLEDLLIKLLL